MTTVRLLIRRQSDEKRGNFLEHAGLIKLVLSLTKEVVQVCLDAVAVEERDQLINEHHIILAMP